LFSNISIIRKKGTNGDDCTYILERNIECLNKEVRTNAPTNERTHQRTNKRTNERTNAPTNELASFVQTRVELKDVHNVSREILKLNYFKTLFYFSNKFSKTQIVENIKKKSKSNLRQLRPMALLRF
jgi:hypothetical protein